MTTQDSDSNGSIQYLPYGPLPLQARARVTWTLEDGPKKEGKNAARRQEDVQFHPFSRLPLELRLRIWDLASPPRTIEIRSWGNTTRHPLTPIKYTTPPIKPPLTLRITHESRLEALRRYTLISLGLSSSTLDPTAQYLDWKHHPSNPYRQFQFQFQFQFHHPRPASTTQTQYLATPYPTQKIYVNWDRDTMYLGPEFQFQHLRSFFTATGPRMELAGLQYLALDRKLFLCDTTAKLDTLLTTLHSLLARPIKEILLIPDDARVCLDDRFYYCEHEIVFREPLYTYSFKVSGNEEEREKTVVENMRVWFERVWKGEGKEPPGVEVMSVRRNGRCLASFKDGVWEIQKVLGGMEGWREWRPRNTL